MNFIDTPILESLNQYANISENFDSIVLFISSDSLIKGGLLIMIVWWGWFKTQRQISIISSILGCFVAMVLARILALSLPERLRPIHESALEFTLPHGVSPMSLDGWSSFPSDHAVLFYALATGIFLMSRMAGVFALLYVTVFVALPRVYLGFHYPTDILGGAFIGVVVVLICNSTPFKKHISQPIYHFSISKPEVFYPIFFMITYQISSMFNSVRDVIGAIL